MGNSGSRLVSDWFTLSGLDDLLSVANNGDLLEFNFGGYSEWGVYIGYNDIRREVSVAWLKDPGNGQNYLLSKAVVCEAVKDVLRQFPGGPAKVRINNELDEKRNPLRNDEIVKRAFENTDMGYDLRHNQSIHFAHWCRYGNKKSGMNCFSS